MSKYYISSFSHVYNRSCKNVLFLLSIIYSYTFKKIVFNIKHGNHYNYRITY